MSRIQIYHDVDGVYNCLPVRQTSERWGWTPRSMLTERINGYQITWSSDMIDAMNEIVMLPDVTSIWLTTWRDDARTMLAPELGIEGATGWEVLHPLPDEDMFRDDRGWWKLNAIQRHVNETRPERVIWLDDDLAFQSEAREWAAAQGNVFHCAPRIEMGLTREMLEQVAEWTNL